MAVIGVAGWVTLGSGLLGAATADSGGGGGGGGQQTSKKEPWAEAAPWLNRQITDGQALQDRYSADPFNAQQKTAYQNTFDDLNNYRSNIAPGIMNFATNAMNGPGYQRQRYARPGMAGYGPQQQPQQPMPQQQPQQPMQQQQPQQPGGLLAPERSGPFNVSGRPGLMQDGARYAPIDFAAQQAPPPQAAPQADPASQITIEEIMRRINEEQAEPQRHPADGGGA